MRKSKSPLPENTREILPVHPLSSAPDTRVHASRKGFLTAEHHDISVAVITAMLFPGGGQFYNGQTGKGVSLAGVTLGGLILIALWVRTPALLVLGLAAGLLLWLVAIIDAAVIANRLIRRDPVRVWQWF